MIHYLAMNVGYSGTPLGKKLGIKDGSEIYVVEPPEEYFALIEPIPKGVRIAARVSRNTDLVHIFTSRRSKLAKALAAYRSTIKPDGAVWVFMAERKSSNIPTRHYGKTPLRGVASAARFFVDIKRLGGPPRRNGKSGPA
jgi:hypothetical protein